MAGSYGHVELGWSLIENMGDAYEMTEELLWLVWTLARRAHPDASLSELHLLVEHLLDTVYYPMCRGEQPKDDVMLAVEERMGQ